MATKTQANPKTVTIFGRLSFPVFTAQEAYDKSQTSKFPAKTVADAKPNFQLLVEQAQLDKLVDKVKKEFFPYVEARAKAGEKKENLDAKELKMLLDIVDDPNFDGLLNTPFKPVHDKTKPMAPEAVAAISCLGNAGVDIVKKARVNNEGELVVPDPDLLVYPAIKPIDQTVHELYPGAYCAATLNLYAYRNGKNPGFSAGVSTIVFIADMDRFGGGVNVDEDEIFAD